MERPVAPGALLRGGEGAIMIRDPELKKVMSEGERNGRTPSGPPTHDVLRDRWRRQHPETAFGLGEWQAYAAGVWQPINELSVKGQVSEMLEDAARTEGFKLTSSALNSVTELAKVKVYVEDSRWNADPDILVCRNSTLHIPTRELREHSPEHYVTSKVPYDYDPSAVAPVWRSYLKETLPDVAEFLQEYFGYALTTDTSHEVALWLYGPPGSGKSTALEGAMAMLGERAGILGLRDIVRNRFALANVPGKSLLLATEQPASYVASTDRRRK